MPDWSDELGRPVMTWIDAAHVIAVDIDPKTQRKRARIRTVRYDRGQWVSREIQQRTVIYGPGGLGGAKSPSKEVWEMVDPNDPAKGWTVTEPEQELRGTLWPLVPLYTGFLRPDVALPPAYQLADLARVHLNKLSRLDAILDTANIPIREWAGITKEQIQQFQALGLKTTFWSPRDAKETRLAYVEHTGNAIAKAIEDLDRTERRMEVMGWAPLVTRPRGNETATSVATEAEAANTQAEAYTIGWADAHAQSAIVMADIAGEDPARIAKIGVQFWHDFGVRSDNLEGLKVLADAMAAKGGPLLPWRVWFKALERHGMLPEDEKPDDLADEMERGEQNRRDSLTAALGA
jgi:hypothetical protein